MILTEFRVINSNIIWFLFIFTTTVTYNNYGMWYFGIYMIIEQQIILNV